MDGPQRPLTLHEVPLCHLDRWEAEWEKFAVSRIWWEDRIPGPKVGTWGTRIHDGK